MPDRSLWKEERVSTSPEDRERLLFQEAETPRPARGRYAWHYILFGFLLSMSLLAVGILIGRNLASDTNSLKCEPKWSPIEDEVDNSYHPVHFNGSLMKENIFRLQASPEVDAAWESLGINYRALAVPEGQAAKAGLRSSQVQINPKYGGGYPANVEGLHHLHCLNLVRQALYYNIDYYRALGTGAFANNDFIIQHHVSHCLDILRQQLMCTPNTSLLGQVWWDRRSPKAFVDFNTEHKCRNFEAIRAWAEERQLSKEVHSDFLQPPRRKEDIYEEILFFFSHKLISHIYISVYLYRDKCAKLPRGSFAICNQSYDANQVQNFTAQFCALYLLVTGSFTFTMPSLQSLLESIYQFFNRKKSHLDVVVS